MINIDLTGAVVQGASPVIDTKHYSTSRRIPRNYRITGSGYGSAPSVVICREYTEGIDQAAFQTAAPSGDIGDMTVIGSSAYYIQDDSGFTALAARYRNGNLTALQKTFSDTEEFRIHHMRKVPLDYSFPGVTEVETAPTGSVFKDFWMIHTTEPSASADLCVPSYNGDSVFIQGNSSKPEGILNTLVNFSDYWSWNSFNCAGFYQISGSPSPITNDGYEEYFFSSDKITATKTTGSIIDSQSVPVHGNPTEVTEGNTSFNIVKIWAYLVSTAGGDYLSNMLANCDYLATGANSYQCLFLINADDEIDATVHRAKLATSWSDTQIDFSTSEFDADNFSHATVLRPDKTWEIYALEDIQI